MVPARRGLADVALAALVVASVAAMVVPLPAFVLDALLTVNLGLAVVVLLVALYVPDALAVASFPTVLLVTTLYRLALDVAATRLILGRGAAGEVIRAFGRFTVRGSYVVGAVVFATLTLVQYLVVARGSERVAEVAARFALDALPGRQLALDAEQRAGAITAAEATRRRRALARESQFYGAMDGAMRFVKGDAVAGIVIAAVNLLGGLALGVGQRGMTVPAALARYGLLTIGEGLVAQIPALVIATAAGILVTRVASEEPGASLGAEIGAQILGDARALGVAAGLLAALALVPGMPAVPFVVVAAVLAVAAWAVARARRLAPGRETAAPLPPVGAPEPLALEVGTAHAARLAGRRAGRRAGQRAGRRADGPGTLGAKVAALREALGRELGVALPDVEIRVMAGAGAGAGADADAVVVRVLEIPAVTVRVPPGAGDEAVLAPLAAALRAHAGRFVGVQATQRLLDGLGGSYPALVRAVVPRPVPLPLLAEVLRRLVDEGVSVRNLPAILEVLAGVAAAENDPAVLVERARAALRREISFRHAPEGRLAAWLLAPEVEEAVRDAARRAPPLLGADLAADVAASVRRALGAGESDDEGAAVLTAVVLTQGDVRRHVRALIAAELPRVVVLAYGELEPGVRVEPAGRIVP